MSGSLCLVHSQLLRSHCNKYTYCPSKERASQSLTYFPFLGRGRDAVNSERVPRSHKPPQRASSMQHSLQLSMAHSDAHFVVPLSVTGIFCLKPRFLFLPAPSPGEECSQQVKVTLAKRRKALQFPCFRICFYWTEVFIFRA